MDWLWFVALVVGVIGLAALAIWRPAQVTVFEYERGLRYRAGKSTGVLAPGRYWYSTRFGRITKVDTRSTNLVVPGQELITSDGIGVKVSLLATIEIADADAAINKVQNYLQAVYAALQVALRDEVAVMTIEGLLGNRSSLGQKLVDTSASRLKEIGIKLKAADVRDVMLPGDLKRAFAQEITARKEAAAALEKTRGETAALRNLANAARMVQDNPALYQLRLLQLLSATGNTLVVGQPEQMPRDAAKGRRRPTVEQRESAPTGSEPET